MSSTASGVTVLDQVDGTWPAHYECSEAERAAALLVRDSVRQAAREPSATPEALRRVGVGDVLVISLPRSNRWRLTATRLRKGGFGPRTFRRWHATDGKALASSRLLPMVLTPKQQWMTRHVNFGWGEFSLGAVGCALSHWGTWRYLANERPDLRAILVFEDDVAPMMSDLPQQVAALVREAGGVDRFDMLRLDWYPSTDFGTRIDSYSKNLWRERGVIYHFTGYVLTQRGARKLLERAVPFYEHIDNHPSFVAGVDPTFVSLAVKRRQDFIVQDRTLKSHIRSWDDGRVLTEQENAAVDDETETETQDNDDLLLFDEDFEDGFDKDDDDDDDDAATAPPQTLSRERPAVSVVPHALSVAAAAAADPNMTRVPRNSNNGADNDGCDNSNALLIVVLSLVGAVILIAIAVVALCVWLAQKRNDNALAVAASSAPSRFDNTK